MLVDSSVWIEHLRRGEQGLCALLDSGDVQTHPHVIGELACGNLNRRDAVLALLAELPAVPEVSNEEALCFLEEHRLNGQGLGWVDIHLLASARLGRTDIWTFDKSLAAIARRLGVAAPTRFRVS